MHMRSDKAFIVEYLVPLSLSVLIVGILLTVYGLIKGTNGSWWVVLGIIVLLIGLLWFVNYLRHIKKFNRLMAEKSKAAFVSTLKDIKFLTDRMPMKYEDAFRDKKKDFGIK